MCGIVAFSGKEPFDLMKINTLLYISSIERGLDSTGIYSPANGLVKETTPGWKFVTEGVIDIIPDNMLMAHVRAKTVGTNIAKNAHPFKRGKCVLIHNGTLKNHWDILHKYELSIQDYDVDSDVLCGAISKTGNLQPLKEIDGAAAVVINGTDEPNKLWIFRNKERPLYRGNIGPNVYICSIGEALVLIGCNNIKEFKEDTLYCIENGELVGNAKKFKNTPYRKPTTNRVTHSVSWVERKAVFSNVRALNSVQIMEKGALVLELIKDKYYKVTKVIDEHSYQIYDTVTEKEFIVNKRLLNLEDVVQDGDYVEAITDVRVKFQSNLAEPTYKKGDVVKVSISYGDGDISIIDKDTTYNYGKMYLKYNFIKLTKEKLKEYLESNKSPYKKTEIAGACNVLKSAVNHVASKVPFNVLENNFNESETNLNSDIISETETETGDFPLPSFKYQGEVLADRVYTGIGGISEKLDELKNIGENQYYWDNFVMGKIEDIINFNVNFYNSIFDDNNKN